MPKILLRCNLLAVHTRTALGKSRKGKGTPAFELGNWRPGKRKKCRKGRKNGASEF
jgi:hypothetical protein